MHPLHATIDEFAADGYTHVELLLPAMPSHSTAAYELASENLDASHAGADIIEVALRRTRRAVAIGQAMASG